MLVLYYQAAGVMSYSVNALTIQVVERMLREKQVELDRLIARRDSVINAQATGTSREQIEAELASVSAQIDTLTAQIAEMPEGINKIKAERSLARLNGSKLGLQLELATNTGEEIPEREFNLAVIDFKITEINSFIADLTARQTALNG